MLEAFEAKYEGGIDAGGTLGSHVGSMMSGLKQSLISFRSKSSDDNSLKSMRLASPPDSPRVLSGSPQHLTHGGYNNSAALSVEVLASCPQRKGHDMKSPHYSHHAFSTFSLDSARFGSSFKGSSRAERLLRLLELP
ncbi:hypothetical protein CEUSTIGMA_g4692.t1 [Chlamydomonas eustigma]|uniref:Uncharacterized protein n=1 Tax=Chlamydomonas eustigma TaxID=1157962 RepID=A0A250X2G3_9CHLO|nr:hypothetical protein CEUSTIGMA_g4692.t1 [Chlamydomonas eustigma]|eukprot:GAX77246.1 hypothetical protein CEUSTIGMA_g4692.t1 [Chlamydomonas eustigma]